MQNKLRNKIEPVQTQQEPEQYRRVQQNWVEGSSQAVQYEQKLTQLRLYKHSVNQLKDLDTLNTTSTTTEHQQIGQTGDLIRCSGRLIGLIMLKLQYTEFRVLRHKEFLRPPEGKNYNGVLE